MDDNTNGIMNEIKKFMKSYSRRITKVLLIVVIVILLLAGSVYYLNVWVDGASEEDWSNVPYAAGQHSSNITIDENGKINASMTAQEIWDKMIESGSRVNLYLDNAEELKKLINAENITQYLDTRKNPNKEINWDKINSKVNKKDIQGIIKLKRKSENGEITTMTYVSPEKFQKYIDKYNSTGSDKYKKRALNHFTLESTIVETESEDTTNIQYYAKVASWNELIDKVESNDPEQQTYTNAFYNMGTTNINYQDLVSAYTMPFDYLWQLLVIGEDKEFVFDLADLVYDSEIEITVHDNLTTNTSVKEYTYRKNEKTVTEATAKAQAISRYTWRTLYSKEGSGSWEDEEGENFKTTYTTITKTNTLAISVTLADIWFAKYTQEYTNEIPDEVVSQNEETLSDIDYSETPTETTENDTHGYGANLKTTVTNQVRQYVEYNKQALNDAPILEDGTTDNSLGDNFYYITSSVDVTEKIYRYSYTNRKEKHTNTVEKNTYINSPAVAEEKTDKNSEEPNFVTIFGDPENTNARNNILSVTEWLFELIENNEKTVNLLDLTKYLLYKATDTDYGITEYIVDSLYTSNLENVGASDYIVNIDKSAENLVISDIETLKKAFSGYSGSSKLIENAETFLEFQETYRVNAVFAAAVSISETSAGRAGHATDGKKNWFNIECHCGDSSHGRFETYESVSESIEKFYNLIANGTYYFKQNKYSVTEIGMIYCENADQPGGWIEVTNRYMTQMFKEAGIELTNFSGIGGAVGGVTTSEEAESLEEYIENEWLHTENHTDNYAYQNGPFAKWWSSSYNTLPKFQCTWWAYGRASQYLESIGSKYSKYPKTPEGRSGNGGEWYDINARYGWFKYGSEPRPNSIVSWKKGTYGHVAYVEGVGSDGTVYVSHAGGGDSWYGVQPMDPAHWGSFILNGYIYLDEPN